MVYKHTTPKWTYNLQLDSLALELNGSDFLQDVR